jgi:hypothetical protein
MKYPKVLVAAPTYSRKEYTREDFVNAVKGLTYPNFDFLVVDNSQGTSYAKKLRKAGLRVATTPRGKGGARECLRNAENYIVDRFIAGDYEYLLMLESDVMVNPTTIQDLMQHMDVQRLDLRHGKRVIASPYLLGEKSLCIAQMKIDPKSGVMGCQYLHGRENIYEFMFKGLQKVHAAGVGCALIHRSIFTQNLPKKGQPIRFWYSHLDEERSPNSRTHRFPDTYFYLDLHNSGIPVYADSDRPVRHNPSDNTRIKL